MPHELKSMDEIDDRLLGRTFVVYRKGTGENVKYKLRTKKTLYTIKVPQNEAAKIEELVTGSGHPIEIIDV